jgi:hypothetical protein
MKSFSVLTVSKRTGWFENAYIQICKQSTEVQKWVMVGETDTLNDVKTNHFFASPKVAAYAAPKKTKLSNLNASLNEGLRHIDTDYVIFYQDFIDLEEDCFEKLLELANEKTFATTCTPNYDGSDDGRYTGCNLPRPCVPSEWEANVAIAPMAMLRLLGGFDEDYDWGWSWDNVNVAERAAMLGAKFILDESNRPKLYPHEMTSHETLPKNGERHAKTMKDIREGRRPLKLDYL